MPEIEKEQKNQILLYNLLEPRNSPNTTSSKNQN